SQALKITEAGCSGEYCRQQQANSTGMGMRDTRVADVNPRERCADLRLLLQRSLAVRQRSEQPPIINKLCADCWQNGQVVTARIRYPSRVVKRGTVSINSQVDSMVPGPGLLTPRAGSRTRCRCCLTRWRGTPGGRWPREGCW